MDDNLLHGTEYESHFFAKREKVISLVDEIQDKTYEVNYSFNQTEAGKKIINKQKNKLARAVLIQVLFGQIGGLIQHKFRENATQDFYNEINKEIELLCDEIIFISQWDENTYDLFWSGKHKYNPKRLSFNEIGKEQVIYIDLNEVAKITIPILRDKT
jgi:hypothetical protein